MMRTANPALNKKTFENTGYTSSTEGTMTLQGTVNKTGFLLTFLILAAAWTWNLYFESNNPASVTLWLIGGCLGGLVVAIITTFKKHLSPITAPIYAILEGLFLGSFVDLFNDFGLHGDGVATGVAVFQSIGGLSHESLDLG